MKRYFEALKKGLEKEFEWFREMYECSLFEKIKLYIYDVTIHGEELRENEKNGYIMYELDAPEKGCDIILILDENIQHDEVDDYVILTHKLGKGYELYFFMLYHELGHLLSLENIYVEDGEVGIRKQIRLYEKQRSQIEKEYELGRLTEEEVNLKYRTLEFEREADEFANEIYHKRVGVIKKYIEPTGVLNYE